MTMRIIMCLILFLVVVMNSSVNSYQLLELKLQVLQFTVPYYFFFMVLVSLFFSAHTFYISLRNILFPQLTEDDGENRSVKLNKLVYVSTRTRFRILLGLVCAILTYFSIIILSAHDDFGSEKIFDKAASTLLYLGDAILYAIQVLALILASILTFRLQKMIKASPSIITDGSTNEERQDSQASEEYKLICQLID